ncbi:TolC family protein [Dyadobacter psychrotolerans]|uniref:TolC family protein n=1 Tax=Dyadobacter psychrotolerans TaxID=2541721 RepID=A0A4R5DUX0_9BACT|nr:TolC family protein [Dyadobacter psychrotolerans]TDE17587.1 TolC family protein [Dyadobacter psychrotolerans]
MSKQGIVSCAVLLSLSLIVYPARAQVLTIQDAIHTAQTNYGTIKAKSEYVNASKATVVQSRKDYLPNLNLSMQQDYGTVNGQNGPLYGMGLSVASSGLPLPEQNWNSAFGALYLTNVNWDFFAFGRAREKIKVSESMVYRDQSDLNQEQFQHGIRVAGAYLSLLAAKRLIRSWENNLQRASGLKNVVVTRAKNGLIPGVDSSLANAEVSNAKISIIQARDYEQEQASRLAQLLGITTQSFVLDTMFITKMPKTINDSSTVIKSHPLLQYYSNRIAVSNQQARYFQTLSYPTLSMFGVFQGRGAGFSATYAADQTAYSHNYFDGVKAVRANYLLGIGATWNLTSILRVKQQVAAQKFVSLGLQEEYNVIDNQIKNQLLLSENKINNAVANFKEAPIQVQSASDAYLQKSVLYKNGLSNIVDITQALYVLNRAETSRDVAFINVWQALLLKAAAAGDLTIFTDL